MAFIQFIILNDFKVVRNQESQKIQEVKISIYVQGSV